MGDSLSAGYGIDQSLGWVSLLQRRLEQQDFPHRVANASISGETTRSALSHVDDELARHDPAIVIIELGANDGLRGLPLDNMAANLSRIIKRSRQAGARVLLVGMRLPPNYGPTYTSRFEQIYSELAARHDVALVPFLLEGFARNTRIFQPDGLHPDEQAQPRILENVWPHLEPMLQREQM